uniref:DDRGK domain-containing protein 1 n=3 Tax=Parascaris univalens TaxID=6257 RepID=A0A915APY4_PARUN
ADVGKGQQLCWTLGMAELDPLLLGSVCFLLTALTFIIIRIVKLYNDETRAHQRTEAILAMAAQDTRRERTEREPLVIAGRRRAAVRRRVNAGTSEDMGFIAAAAAEGLNDSEQEEEATLVEALGNDEHIGKKKLAKLQAKAERKAQREAERIEREERKKEEKEREEMREAEREKQRLQEEAEKERKRIEREEREKREEEEYQKMKEAFEVAEEGFDLRDDEENEDLMRQFVDYIKDAKVVSMDELGAHFKLRTEEAVDRLNYFIENGTLTGVTDDRGKFIYITEEELQAVAKFINQRGRVSLSELAEYSNRLISLESNA